MTYMLRIIIVIIGLIVAIVWFAWPDVAPNVINSWSQKFGGQETTAIPQPRSIGNDKPSTLATKNKQKSDVEKQKEVLAKQIKTLNEELQLLRIEKELMLIQRTLSNVKSVQVAYSQLQIVPKMFDDIATATVINIQASISQDLQAVELYMQNSPHHLLPLLDDAQKYFQKQDDASLPNSQPQWMHKLLNYLPAIVRDQIRLTDLKDKSKVQVKEFIRDVRRAISDNDEERFDLLIAESKRNTQRYDDKNPLSLLLNDLESKPTQWNTPELKTLQVLRRRLKK